MKKFWKVSLKQKMQVLTYSILVPFAVLTIFMIFTLARYTREYDGIVSNVTTASEFTFDFKSNVDAKMYQVAIGTKKYEDLRPDQDIEIAQDFVERLKSNASTRESKAMVNMLGRSLESLKSRMEEIEVASREVGNYDYNMKLLDDNVYMLTSLIQESVWQYIYYETVNLEVLKTQMSKEVNQTIGISIMAFFITLIMVWWLTRKISQSITKPLELLSEHTRLVGKGDFSIRADEDKSDEIQVLSHNFNRMVERIGDLVEDVKTEQLQLRDTELKLLQSQINPHFLYNTLDTIIWLAEDKQNEEVIAMVKSLSSFFRTSVSQGKDYITILEEKKHVESYLEIQQFRYQDILEYEIDIPEELEKYRVLKLTLQPLVENALYHGIKQKRGMGKISIRGSIHEDTITLVVKDNGNGMDEQILEEVQKSIYRQKDEEAHNSFGLYNVNERIRLHFGEQYGLVVRSVEGEGTESIVTIKAVQ